MKDPWSSWSLCVLKKYPSRLSICGLQLLLLILVKKKKDVVLLELSIQSTFLESQIKN